MTNFKARNRAHRIADQELYITQTIPSPKADISSRTSEYDIFSIFTRISSRNFCRFQQQLIINIKTSALIGARKCHFPPTIQEKDIRVHREVYTSTKLKKGQVNGMNKILSCPPRTHYLLICHKHMFSISPALVPFSSKQVLLIGEQTLLLVNRSLFQWQIGPGPILQRSC